MASIAGHFVAGGTINPARFVTLSTSKDQTLLQASTAGQRVLGIAQTGTKYPPGVTGSTTVASDTDGDPIMVFLPGERAQLEAGSGGWTAGDLLKTDANGKGITAASTGQVMQWVGAIAEETVAAGDVGCCRVVIFPFAPSVS